MLDITPFGADNSTANNIVLVLTTGTELVIFGMVFIDSHPSVAADAWCSQVLHHGFCHRTIGLAMLLLFKDLS
jgi:hypothetical protein